MRTEILHGEQAQSARAHSHGASKREGIHWRLPSPDKVCARARTVPAPRRRADWPDAAPVAAKQRELPYTRKPVRVS